MKSSIASLKKRGFVEEEELEKYTSYSKRELLVLLHNDIPQLRTIGATLLREYPHDDIIDALCISLQKEKKLYTKIAITETLASFNTKSLPFLIPLLGTIGNNQYKDIPVKKFQKKNYPLPRDIVARTIIRIGEECLPSLEQICMSGNRKQILEAIDAIGYITYYSKNFSSLGILQQLLIKFQEDHLLLWKIIRAFESYPLPEIIDYLKEIQNNHPNPLLRDEAQRSLNQISYNFDV